MALANKAQDTVRGSGAEDLSYGVMIDSGGLHAASRESNFITIGIRICKFIMAIGPCLKAQGKFAMLP
jgi:hypothetical protein